MYSHNFPEKLDDRRLTLLLLSQVIPTETIVLKDIYKMKQKLEMEHINSKEYRMLLRQIRCLQPGFIVYETVDYGQVDFNEMMNEYDTTKCINLKPLTQQTEGTDERKIPQGIKMVNRIFKEYETYNPDKVDEDHRATYLQDRVKWANKLGSGGDDPEHFQITGDQRLNKTFDKRQKDFNNMCIMGYDNNNQFQYSIVVSEMLYYIFFDA